LLLLDLHNILHVVHLKLDVAIGRYENLRGPSALSVDVVLNAVVAANQLRSFAFGVVREMCAARNTLGFVVLVAVLHNTKLFVYGMMELSWLQRFGRNDLDLSEILAAFVNEILRLHDVGLLLRDNCHGVVVVRRIVLIVRALVLVEER